MSDLLWLIPALPFAGFLLIVLGGRRLSPVAAAWVGCGAVGLAAALTMAWGVALLCSPPEGGAIAVILWTWFDVGGLSPAIGLRLDALALVMTAIITFVGFLIHVYATEYMRGDRGYNRFFAYLNLFVGFMLVLVLADNLALLLVGWEGVGLCSYLLIGFWFEDPANGRAARKAFVVTRVGDTAMLVGLFLLFHSLGTLNLQELLGLAVERWEPGSPLAVAVAALLLGGALGKSAQAPLQVWLPDAMAGPTPVSALIHAATMVTAGVYLIARTHALFLLAPAVMLAVAVIGAVTLLLAGFSALCQSDIKRVLAYSTISQIGYMFFALGVGAWSAAMFHFFTHAFFKALLFLGAGAVILAQHHEQNMFKMGGLRRELPLVFWTFLIGSASLAAVPLVTSGFFSKEAILINAWTSEAGHPLLWAAGAAGALLTALYTTRMMALTFFGRLKIHVTHRPGKSITLVLVVLAVLSTVAGWVEMPATLGGVALFSGMLATALPAAAPHATLAVEIGLQAVAALLVAVGIFVGWRIYRPESTVAERALASPAAVRVRRFWESGWGFDWLYDAMVVRPFIWLARVNRDDAVDSVYERAASVSQGLHALISRTQTGQLRWYLFALVFGSTVLLMLALVP